MEKTFQHFGKALRVLRELRGMNQAELARKAGIGKSQLSKYEGDRELPRLDSLERILAALRVSHLGFFYTLDFIQAQAKALAGGTEVARRAGAVTEFGVLTHTAHACGRAVGEVMMIYQSILDDVLKLRSPS
jgi:transcriptional regulator with XRE-family HTH domain